MNPTAQKQSTSSSSHTPPPFDPKQPALPISYPIKTLEELESRAYFDSFHYPFNIAKVKLQSSNTDDAAAALPNRRRILVCHDMAGGYIDDKWIQGGNNPDAYAIWHWYLMDVFVYFSHNLVTLPPPCWTNTAHKHGVKVLGTFIMEGGEGAIIANKLLSTIGSARMYAERLAELALALGFDGWLINMEVYVEQVSNLKEFVSHLTQTMHSSVPGSLIIWYDSVTSTGTLDWQNQLNDSNKPFFDICDGIYINYFWQEYYVKLSAEVAGDRKFDVYMGIDVFGRGTFGGGQWTTNVAIDVLRENDVSAAIFAPGWVYENLLEKKEFQTLQNRWWGLIEKSWGTLQKYPRVLPFYSNFDQGHGYHFSIDRRQVSDAPWNNISSQGLQPLLEFSGDSNPDTVRCYVDFKEPSYSGGGNITFRGTLQKNAFFTARLFEGELLMGNSPVAITYSVKLNGSSLLGLVLYFSSDANEKKTVFLAPQGNTLLTMNRFSSQFTNVIMPHQVTKPETEPKWTIKEFRIAMEGHMLTKIYALCYKLESEFDELQVKPESRSQHISLAGSLEYYAVLGHIRISASAKNKFPPSMFWLVEGQYVKWTSGSQDSKYLSSKIIWQFKNGSTGLFPEYNIYVKKLSKSLAGKPSEVIEGVEEYLGVAEVEAFYVSDLVVPAGTSSLKFIIQVCSLDGHCQKLKKSPFLQLEVESS